VKLGSAAGAQESAPLLTFTASRSRNTSTTLSCTAKLEHPAVPQPDIGAATALMLASSQHDEGAARALRRCQSSLQSSLLLVAPTVHYSTPVRGRYADSAHDRRRSLPPPNPVTMQHPGQPAHKRIDSTCNCLSSLLEAAAPKTTADAALAQRLQRQACAPSTHSLTVAWFAFLGNIRLQAPAPLVQLNHVRSVGTSHAQIACVVFAQPRSANPTSEP